MIDMSKFIQLSAILTQYQQNLTDKGNPNPEIKDDGRVSMNLSGTRSSHRQQGITLAVTLQIRQHVTSSGHNIVIHQELHDPCRIVGSLRHQMFVICRKLIDIYLKHFQKSIRQLYLGCFTVSHALRGIQEEIIIDRQQAILVTERLSQQMIDKNIRVYLVVENQIQTA